MNMLELNSDLQLVLTKFGWSLKASRDSCLGREEDYEMSVGPADGDRGQGLSG